MARVVIGVCDGVVKCAVVVPIEGDSPGAFDCYHKAMKDWKKDPKVHELIEVPVEVARRYLFKQWPGFAVATEAVK